MDGWQLSLSLSFLLQPPTIIPHSTLVIAQVLAPPSHSLTRLEQPETAAAGPFYHSPLSCPLFVASPESSPGPPSHRQPQILAAWVKTALHSFTLHRQSETRRPPAPASSSPICGARHPLLCESSSSAPLQSHPTTSLTSTSLRSRRQPTLPRPSHLLNLRLF
jgi:hypothetical protein